MSAECATCGSYIYYPEGTWPVGVCRLCELRDLARRAVEALAAVVGWAECYRHSEDVDIKFARAVLADPLAQELLKEMREA